MRKLFALLAIMATCFVGCEPIETPEQTEISLELGGTTLTFEAEGGNSSIAYRLTGADNEARPEATADVEWISDITVNSQNIAFTIAPNDSNEERTATLTATYADQSASITIIQNGVENSGNEDNEDNEDNDNGGEATEFDGEPNNYNFKHRILLIDHTGTDCGYCPYMMVALKEVEEDPIYSDYFNIAMAHSYNQSDKAYSRAALIIRGYYQVTMKILTGFPTLTFNYQYKGKSGQYTDEIKNHISKLKKESTDAAVAVRAELVDDKIMVDAVLKSKVARNYKINILLLEDGIYSKQYNASEDWMNTHNNAIRDSYFDLPTDYSDISGVEWGDVEAMTTEQKSFEVPISKSDWVKENCKVLVIISAPDAEYGNKYEVVNTTMCNLGQTKPFEYR